MGSAGREHRAADEVDVVVGTALVLGRDDVGAEEGDVVRERGGNLAEPALGLDVEPVAALDLEVGDPGPQSLGPAALGQRAQLVGARGARRGRGLADPARLVRAPRHPRRELVGPVPGEDEMRVTVDEARDNAAAVRVEALVAGSAGGLDRRHSLALDHQRGVADDPQGTLPALRFVRDEEPDVVDDQAHARAPIAFPSSAATSMPRCRRRRPPAARHDHLAHVGRGRREDQRGDGIRAIGAHQPRRRDRPRRDRVAPRLDPPASASRGTPCPSAAADSSSAAEWRPRSPVASRSSSSTARASSNVSTIAFSRTRGEPGAASASRGPGRRRRPVALGRRVLHRSRASRCEFRSARSWRGPPRALVQAPASASTAAGVAPLASARASFSAGCSERSACSGGSLARPAGDDRGGMQAPPRGRYRSRCRSARRRPPPDPSAFRPRLGVGVGEPSLRPLGLGADPAVEVAGVDQRDPHPASTAAETKPCGSRRGPDRGPAGPVVDDSRTRPPW